MIGPNYFTKDNLIDILKKNFGYRTITDEIFGKALKMDIVTSYRFCLTTNSYYPIDKYGLRLFGRFRTFNHRNLSLNPGLFMLNAKTREISDQNLLFNLFEKYPFIFKGDKSVIFVESKNTSKVISEAYKKITEGGKNPNDYIINLIHKNGSQWEHYFEFMASEIFIQKGYLTDVQLPWSYHGTPDFGAYKHELVNLLSSMSLIKNGALILELSALRFLKKLNKPNNLKGDNDKKEHYEFIVGEVKSRQSTSQIKTYLKVGLCSRGYEFIPNKRKMESFCGLININYNNKIDLKVSPQNIYLDPYKIKKDLEWFNCYIKIHLLGNLTISEIEDLMLKHRLLNSRRFSNLIKLVQKIKLSELLGLI